MVALVYHEPISSAINEIEMLLINNFFSEILAELLQRIEPDEE